MWMKLQDTPPFYFQFLQNNEIEISVTDYVTVYSIYLSENDFISTLKESNPALEITSSELLDKGKHMFLNTDNLKSLDITKKDAILTLSMCSLFGHPLKLNIALSETTKEVFFYKVTQPLLKTIKDLQSSELELRQALKEKDAEIEKYKEEGSKIRKHWKTKAFNEEEHMKKHEVYKDNFVVSQDLPSTLLEKKQEGKINGCEVKQETNVTLDSNIKQELITPTLEEPKISLVARKIEIKQEVKSESQRSSVVQIKKRKKLNL